MQTLLRIAIAVFFLVVPQALAAKRVGFVVGINQYSNLPADRQLRTAVSDASTIARTLQDMGFDHIEFATDTDGDQFIQKFSVFLTRIEPGDTAFFFYAGHGLGMKTGNFLLPGDIPPVDSWNEITLERSAVSEAFIIEKIQQRGARLAVLVIDACRNSPFGENTRSLTRDLGMQQRGLVEPVKAVGVFTIYSAGIGQTALDRLSDNEPVKNSVFTRVFAEKLRQSDVHLADLAVDVRETVAELAATVIDPDTRKPHQQNVAYYDQTRGGRIFLGGTGGAQVPSTENRQKEPVATEPAVSTLAADFDLARSLGSKEAFEAFVERHGSSDDMRVALAKKELAKKSSGVGGNAGLGNSAALLALNRPIGKPQNQSADFSQCKRLAARETVSFEALKASTLETAEQFCRAALAQNPDDPVGQYLLGRVLTAQPVSSDRDPNVEAGELFEAAAASGNGQAASGLAYLYVWGLGGYEKSDAKALAAYHRAGDLGDPQGFSGVAWMYEEGRGGLPKDPREAMRWYRRAADTGDAKSMSNVGYLYETGNGVEKDLNQSAAWYRKSAEAGDSYGMQRLGIAYAYGEGVPKDENTAFQWYLKAQAAGESEVSNNLAYAYANGSGTAKDPAQAARWFLEAVKLKTSWSQSQIGSDDMNAFDGDSLKELQRSLKESGQYSGPVDGAYGPKMKAALEAYAAGN